ncbi:MAG: hypothetical protein ABR543_00195 [Gemmatimonadaceae bacterium]
MPTQVQPYEVILGPLEAAAFPAIEREAVQRGTDTLRHDLFLLLGQVGATLKRIVPDEAPADAVGQYAELLYHGYHFWSFGKPLHVFDDEATTELTMSTCDFGAWDGSLPSPTCRYFRFPYQRIWARVAADAPFEPVDGVFVVTMKTTPSPGATTHLRSLLVLGFRVERMGASLVSYSTDLDSATTLAHAREPCRDGAPAFSNAIPGGERKDYRAILTTSELEALAVRALWVEGR